MAKAISGVLVRPKVVRPAARNCVIRWESSVATWPAPRRLGDERGISGLKGLLGHSR